MLIFNKKIFLTRSFLPKVILEMSESGSSKNEVPKNIFFVSISTNRLRNQGVDLQKQFCIFEKDKQCRIETWSKSNISLIWVWFVQFITFFSILDSMVVSIPAFHAGDRGSIHRWGDSFLICFSSICCFGIPYHTSSLILGIRLAAIKINLFVFPSVIVNQRFST